MVHRDQVLGPVLHPADRPPQRPGQPRHEVVLRVELAAGAEPASRVHRVHCDQRLVHAEQRGEQVPVEHRHLGHAPDLQAAGDRVGLGQQGARLQRHGPVPAGLHRHLGHGGGPGERGGHVAIAQGQFGGHVAAREQPRRARPGGRGRIQHRGPLVDVGVHQLGGVLGAIGVVGDHDGHRLADVAHDPVGQHRLQVAVQVDALHRQPDRDPHRAGQVGRGHHGHHPGRGGGRPGADRAEPAVGHRGAGHPGPQLAGPPDVGPEPALAAQQPRVLFARDARPDTAHRVPASPAGSAASAVAASFPASARPSRERAVASTASTMP